MHAVTVLDGGPSVCPCGSFIEHVACVYSIHVCTDSTLPLSVRVALADGVQTSKTTTIAILVMTTECLHTSSALCCQVHPWPDRRDNHWQGHAYSIVLPSPSSSRTKSKLTSTRTWRLLVLLGSCIHVGPHVIDYECVRDCTRPYAP